MAVFRSGTESFMTAAHWDIARSLPGDPLIRIADFVAFVEGLDHPEGVATASDGSLLCGRRSRTDLSRLAGWDIRGNRQHGRIHPGTLPRC